MNVTFEHPSVEKLSAFGLGRLGRGELAEVEQHVAECDTCRQVLETLPDDSLIVNLRGSSAVDPAKLHDAATQAHLPARAPVSTDVPPELIDHPRYRVEKLLGVGGMGAVFKAEHLLMKRSVALKVINKQLFSNSAAVERFRREVVAAGNLIHPNIVHAYDAEQNGDMHFLVMEYVEGTSLAKLVAEKGALPVHLACDYIRQAAVGLQHAHERGMVHRDIKPHNLMVLQSRDRQGAGRGDTPLPDGRGSDGGIVKILDFGLARFALESAPPAAGAPTVVDSATPAPESAALTTTHASPFLTQDGAVIGTPDYIAPEQVRDAHTADIRADIYSLGCTLYDLLTGKPPFPEGTAMQKVVSHLERTPRPLAELRPEVPPELVRVVEKMMAKEPAERYQTPADVAEALAPCTTPLSGGRQPPESTSAGDSSGGLRPPLRRPRRRLRCALAASAILVALAMLAYALFPPVQDFAQTVIRIATNKGVLEIEADDEDLEITIKQEGKETAKAVVVNRKTKHTFELTAVGGEIIATDILDKQRLKTTEFTLERGGRTTLRARVLLAAKSAGKSDDELIQGKWVAVWAEMSGKPATEDMVKKMTMTFTGDKVEVTQQDGKRDQGIFNLDPRKAPKQMIIEGKSDASWFRGIYKLEGDRLTVCMGKTGTPTEFKSSPRTPFLLVEFRRDTGKAGDTAFQPLFNGKDLDGWETLGDRKKWQVRDRSLVAMQPHPQGQVKLRTRADYEDYELRLEYQFAAPKARPAASARVLLHGADRNVLEPPLFALALSPDDRPTILRGYGAAQGQWSSEKVEPKDGWNELRIVARGRSLAIYLNGALAATAKDCSPAKGFIGLENTGTGEVLFRNIEIRPLLATEPVFRPLFNGKDLTGWIGTDKGWTVSDQVLSNKGHPNAFLRTEKTCENYLLGADFRCPDPVPSQQTTGLLVHVQKMGDSRTPAYVIPLVNPFSGAVVVRGDAKAKWDEVRASWRPRPEGAWNQLRVRCQGDVIELTINGELIGRLTNCDLKSGFIAFHAQNNVLYLRNIQIHELPAPAPVQSRE